MTPTAEELYNSVDFWEKRYTEQKDYIIALMDDTERPVKRKIELLISARQVMFFCVVRISVCKTLKICKTL